MRLHLHLLLLLLWAMPVRAHHDAAVTIAELTEQISNSPKLPELYYQRGVEVLSTQQLPAARADFEQALKLRPDYLPAKRYLATITNLEGYPERALQLLQEAISKAPEEHRFLLPSCHQLEAELLVQLKQFSPALTAVKLALDTAVPALETLRLQAQILRELGQDEAALTSLKEAWLKTHAIILRNEWLDTLIDLGRNEEALPLIQQELESTRFRSSWLLRRARIFLQQKRTAEAKLDLQAAIDELTPRLAITPPPALLLCDRGLAYAMLGQIAPAEQDLADARRLGVSETSCRLLVAILRR
jgi:tetratricopeptide (TPR) repeat protein